MKRLGIVIIWDLVALSVMLDAVQRVKYPQSSSGLRSDCIGSQMRLTLDEALAVGNQLEVEAINGTRYVLLTPSLAAQCGYSMESDPWGNTRIYTSLMGCYVDNKVDASFDVGLRLQMYSPELTTHKVHKTCRYTAWAFQEIVCDRNYMEVSNHVDKHDAAAETARKSDSNNLVPSVNNVAQGIWKMTFYTPEPISMTLGEAQQAGFGAMTTTSRLVLRSPYNMAHTYYEDEEAIQGFTKDAAPKCVFEVAGVPMEVFKVSTYYSTTQGMNIMNTAAACPTGGVMFNEDVISWHVPHHISPLISGAIKILEMHMGINGERLDNSQMAARQYTLSANEFHMIINVKIGSPDGYFKSHGPDYKYHITYSIEPMLELLWQAEDTQARTRYKVLFPITTPLMPWLPEVSDRTVPGDKMFNVQLGTFLHDVELMNITFSTGVLSVAECNARGLVVRENKFLNGSKTFSLKVPFSDEVVVKHNPELLITTYSLPLIYGFMIQPDDIPFSHSLNLQASLQDVVLPKITGTCDQTSFYIAVEYGSQGRNIQSMIGRREVTPSVAEAYKYTENATHSNVVVPYTSLDSVFERVDADSVKARLDLLLWEPINNWKLSDFSLACNFPLVTTTCYANGMVTALAIKVESVPNLTTSWLTLRDKSCKPVYSNDHFAQFSFDVNSCGTTRVFSEGYVVYQNEVYLNYYSSKAYTTPADPEYRQTIFCYYAVKDTATLTFHERPRSKQPTAEIGSGRLIVQMTLAQDESYQLFHQAADFPIVKYLRQPVYFEVALMQSNDPQLKLVLENCWATFEEEKTSLPSWDIIIDGCENFDDGYTTVLLPVASDARVTIPSHVKHFSVKMFTFVKDNDVAKDQIYVHCDAVICEASAVDGICSGECLNSKENSQTQNIKGQNREQRASSTQHLREQISSGPIRVMN